MTGADCVSVVFAGHVDHGKSTLLGRLYSDTGSLPVGHLEKVRDTCERQGKSFEYAFLFDAFLEEQEQGITIDTARTFFNWKGRRYLILDAPGHKEFLKNMITGASRAEAAVLLVDAVEGIQEQSRRHAYLLKLMGIRQLLVVVNKMDLVDFSEEIFAGIERELGSYLAALQLSPLRFVPVSARHGDNVTSESGRLAWYRGPTLLQCIEALEKLSDRDGLPLRFPVQDVYKFDGRRIVAGRVESGVLRVGDLLVFSPSGKRAKVRSIEAFNAPAPPKSVAAGYSTGVTLAEQIFIERGEVASLPGASPTVTSRLHAVVFWLGKGTLERGKALRLRLATCEVGIRIEEVVSVIDCETQQSLTSRAVVEQHEVAELLIRTERPVPLDRYADLEATGRFVIVDGYEISGGGVVIAPVTSPEGAVSSRRRGELASARHGVTLEERMRRNGHPAALVLLTGRSGLSGARTARQLERELFGEGILSWRLGARYLKEEGGRPGGRGLARVVRPLLDAGLVVLAGPVAVAGLEQLAREIAPYPLVCARLVPQPSAKLISSGKQGPFDIDVIVRLVGDKLTQLEQYSTSTMFVGDEIVPLDTH